jgi:hypothetical protein
MRIPTSQMKRRAIVRLRETSAFAPFSGNQMRMCAVKLLIIMSLTAISVLHVLMVL